MSIDFDKLRKSLTDPSPEELTQLLKKWRARGGLTQGNAAANLGVSTRTLQGWEAGRSMPYPHILFRAVNSTGSGRAGLVQADFPREFAEFVGFVGGDELNKRLERAAKKLGQLSRPARHLYGDRFFFHEQILLFATGDMPFHLDITNLQAVRSASLIAGINRIRQGLSRNAQSRFRAMILDNLQPDRDIRQIEHEIRCWTHFTRKGFKVVFADLEGLGNFDLLVQTPIREFEVECKTIGENTGSQAKVDTTAELAEIFQKSMLALTPVAQTGLFVLQLKKPIAECRHLAKQLREALTSPTVKSHKTGDFTLTFLPKPDWDSRLNSEWVAEFSANIQNDPDVGNNPCCFVRTPGPFLGLVVRQNKQASLALRIVKTIKDASDQCSGGRPCIPWLHLLGLTEQQFLQVAKFSSDGQGNGLNAIVARAIAPSPGSTARAHVERVRFSAVADHLSQGKTVGPSLLIQEAVSSGGAAYDIPNPNCRFEALGEI